ncbi:MAG: ABC transporter permease [Oscillospiraceae bacterium]
MKNKKTILLYALNTLFLILIALCLLKIHSYSNVLLSQQAADYWKGDSKERFAQVSCFFPVDKPTSTDAIKAFRKTIDSKLVDAGVEPKDDGEYWTDCYSVRESLTVKGDRNSSEATVIGVGGDFFLFHPYELLSGSYIAEDDLMKDRVILDYELAWKLFGGEQLAGMTVTIDGKPYYVAGVVRRETDEFSDKAFSGEPVMFMSYDTLSSLKAGTDGGMSTGAASGAGIDCYEIAMPDPISNFAKAFVTDSFKTAKGVVVENSTRYSFSSIFSMFRKFGSRSIYDSGVIYPYWENAARVSEVYVARLYVFILLLAIFPFICLIVLAARLIKRLTIKTKILKFQLADAWDDRYAREASWKERRAQKRIAKNLKKHERSRKRKENPPKRVPATGQKALPAENADALEKEFVPDIESIVREIMEEMRPGNKP